MAEYYIAPASGTPGSGNYRGVWTANASRAVGDRVFATRNNGTVARKRYCYEVTTAGTGGGTEPAWNTTVGGTTTDGTAVLTTRECDSWTNAHIFFEALLNERAMTGSDVVYVDNTYDSAATTGISNNSNNDLLRIISVSPGTTTPEAGAVFRWSASIAINCSMHVYGVKFSVGSGTANRNLIFADVGTNHNLMTFDNCVLELNCTGTSSAIYAPSSGSNGSRRTIFNNCQFKFGSTAQYILCRAGVVEFNNCSLASGSSVPASLLTPGDFAPTTVKMNGCNFSVAGSLLFVNRIQRSCCEVIATNCSVPLTVTGTRYPGSASVELFNCGTDDNNYRYYKHTGNGTVQTNTAIYRTTGGATTVNSNGETVPYSLQMTASSTATYCDATNPLYTPWVYLRVDSTGSKTVSMEAAADTTVTLTNQDLWIEVQYMGGDAAPNTPQGLIEATYPLVSGTKSRDVLAAGTALTDTGDAWTGIPDTNEKNYTLSKSVTINEQGYIRARVGYARVTPSAPMSVYVDPVLTVS